MLFSTDVDLVRHEPSLHAEVGFASQRLWGPAPAVLLESGTIIQGLGELEFNDWVGSVLLVDGVPFEVTGHNTGFVQVSRIRQLGDPILIGSERPVSVPITAELQWFGPQRDLAYRQILAMLGLCAQGAPGDGPDASVIVNRESLRLLETYGALHLIYAAGASAASEESALWSKAQLYRVRYARERERVAVELDLDGDGMAEVIRRPSVVHLVRG
ncbi:MAG: hypothetical protein AAGI30_08775 [Planctomycetota bacterium]